MRLLSLQRSRAPGKVCEHTRESFTRSERERERERERETDSHLEAMGHMAAKATWSTERTGQCTVQVQVLSTKQRAKERFFVPLVLLVLCVG